MTQSTTGQIFLQHPLISYAYPDSLKACPRREPSHGLGRSQKGPGLGCLLLCSQFSAAYSLSPNLSFISFKGAGDIFLPVLSWMSKITWVRLVHSRCSINRRYDASLEAYPCYLEISPTTLHYVGTINSMQSIYKLFTFRQGLFARAILNL